MIQKPYITRKHAHTYRHDYAQTHMHTHTHTHTHTVPYMPTRTYIFNAHTCTQTHAHTHTHTKEANMHTDIYTQKYAQSGKDDQSSAEFNEAMINLQQVWKTKRILSKFWTNE